MDWPEMIKIVERVQYKDWRFILSMDGPRAVLQVDLGNGWKSRKWLLSSFMTESELVQTCLKAVLTAEEHEARERFTYEGVCAFGPHINVRELLRVANSLETRTPSENAPSKKGDNDERF